MADDPRRRTEAAIEATERERLHPDLLFDRDDEEETQVVWRAGDAEYYCYADYEPESDVPDALLVWGDEGLAAFRLHRRALREHLDAYDLLERPDGLAVLTDDLEWFEPESDRYRADGTPTEAALDRLREDAPFEYRGPCENAGVAAVLDELRTMYRNGSAVAGTFALTDDEFVAELWNDGGLEYERGDFCLGDAFLRSDAVAAFLADATPGDHTGEPTFERPLLDLEERSAFRDGEYERLTFESVRPTRLGARIAETLLAGGAYRDFEGTHEEALALGRRCSDALRDGLWSDSIDVYLGQFGWSDWFVGTQPFLDTTIVVTERDAGRIRLLVGTDTD